MRSILKSEKEIEISRSVTLYVLLAGRSRTVNPPINLARTDMVKRE